MPTMHFFIPQNIIEVKQQTIIVHKINVSAEKMYNEIEQVNPEETFQPLPSFIKRISKPEYLANIKTIKDHIIKGDVYELNYCQEFYANATIQPISTYLQLNKYSKAPFSTYYKLDKKYLLCCSPERFLKKTDNKLIAQPIKGTSKRSTDKKEDQKLMNELSVSLKEQAENVMIVDLMRNDLSKSAVPGSVTVDELFGIYTFELVHQMISTISSTLRPDVHFINAIKNAFPMGSMTGAPKIAAMQLIEQYETTKRGLFSGAVGYILPNNDFDFNVVIRSLLYNHINKYISYQVGGAITDGSVPEREYEECLVKAQILNLK